MVSVKSASVALIVAIITVGDGPPHTHHITSQHTTTQHDNADITMHSAHTNAGQASWRRNPHPRLRSHVAFRWCMISRKTAHRSGDISHPPPGHYQTHYPPPSSMEPRSIAPPPNQPTQPISPRGGGGEEGGGAGPGLGVPAEALLEEPGELGVAVGDVLLQPPLPGVALRQPRDHVAQRRQRLVDVHRLRGGGGSRSRSSKGDKGEPARRVRRGGGVGYRDKERKASGGLRWAGLRATGEGRG